MESLIELLGWRLSTSEEKRKPFAEKFVALGVDVDLSESSVATLKLQNKPGRAEGIEAAFAKVKGSPGKLLGFKDALSLGAR